MERSQIEKLEKDWSEATSKQRSALVALGDLGRAAARATEKAEGFAHKLHAVVEHNGNAGQYNAASEKLRLADDSARVAAGLLLAAAVAFDSASCAVEAVRDAYTKAGATIDEQSPRYALAARPVGHTLPGEHYDPERCAACAAEPTVPSRARGAA